MNKLIENEHQEIKEIKEKEEILKQLQNEAIKKIR